MAKNGPAKTALQPKDFLLRKMPAELLRRLRSYAGAQDKKPKAVVIEALEEYLDGKVARGA